MPPKRTYKNQSEIYFQYFLLLLFTGVIGSLIAIPLGYLVTRIGKFNDTGSWIIYGWRGLGFTIILFIATFILRAIF